MFMIFDRVRLPVMVGGVGQTGLGHRTEAECITLARILYPAVRWHCHSPELGNAGDSHTRIIEDLQER